MKEDGERKGRKKINKDKRREVKDIKEKKTERRKEEDELIKINEEKKKDIKEKKTERRKRRRGREEGRET